MDNVALRPRSVKPDRNSSTSSSATQPTGAPVRTSICGYVYAVRRLSIHPSIGTVAYAVDKLATRNTYIVHRDTHGEVCCDCPDFELRRAGTGKTCKHGARLVELGLIEAPGRAVSTSRTSTYRAVVVQPDASSAAPIPSVERPQSSPVGIPQVRLRLRPYEPTPEESALAAQMFARG